MKRTHLVLAILSLIAFAACRNSNQDWWTGSKYDQNGQKPESSEKPKYIWIDAAANFPDFANSRENILRDLRIAKETGFTDIVVDVRPESGDILFHSSALPQVKYLYAWINGSYSKVERTETWDYLQAFIDAGHGLGLKVHAAINTFVGGTTENGGTGMLFRDDSLKAWATSLNSGGVIMNTMDTGERTKFLNPANKDVQKFICSILKDLAAYNLDGIILDRARFQGIQSDFSDISKAGFEKFLGGTAIENFPEDIMPRGWSALPPPRTDYIDRWLEYRASVIYEFMTKAREAVKSVNDNIRFGVYVGGWYSSYYEVGVNWASKDYRTSDHYSWANERYRNYAIAGFMDQMLIGAYATPESVYGNTEWTMSGFCRLAKDKIRGACPIVAGGPDVGNWDPQNKYSQTVENEAITQSVKACMDACDGYFLFDMIHLKMADQWKYVKEGIDKVK